MAQELTAAQEALIPTYVSRFIAQGLNQGTGTRDLDTPIYKSIERAYKNAIRRNDAAASTAITQVPMVVCGSLKHIVQIMKARIAGSPSDVISTIQAARHGGQFWSATDARFRFHIEVLGLAGEALNWNEVSDLYRNNAGLFMFSNVCYAIRMPIRYDSGTNDNLTPVWTDEFAPTVYTPQNPTDLDNPTVWDMEDVEDIPDTKFTLGSTTV